MKLVDAASCDDKSLTLAAELVYSSLSMFYDIFASFGVPVKIILAESFRVRGCSVSNAILALDAGGNVGGVMADLGLSEMQRALYSDLQLFMRRAEKSVTPMLRDALQTHAAMIPPIAGAGRYLARFAVGPGMQGSGLADLLLDRFEQNGSNFYLHVHRDNKRAISFYQRRDYVFAAGSEREFCVMSKKKL